MFKRVLIANRGEIACRIIHTCRRLGIESIGVYSEADRNALHVRLADHAVAIGAAPPGDSYLNIGRLVRAATELKADAVHPGYGFLSENTAFAEALESAGVIFIGPPVAAVRAMGAKADAKRVMEQAGVPTIPGYHGEDQSAEQLRRQAEQIGYPVMIKASAGGGGKGMRIVRQADDFEAALESARRESRKAFGDDAVILERYIERPRHIEIQVFADRHDRVIHLFERDCSTQRRYQKVIEEAPSPALDDATRAGMGEAAVNAARAVDYQGAGTVEFIVDQNGDYYFMEMNTRLQVEHPVTEMITGLDLVEWQLQVAAGQPLPLSQHEVSRHGHAIEARIYAEDPAAGFLPSSGRLERLRLPDAGNGIRIDSGVLEGDQITVHYDPMIAKLIVHADNRQQALDKLQQALAATAVIGPATNVGFLQRLTEDQELRRGSMHTAYLDQQLDRVLAAPAVATDKALLGAALTELCHQETASQLAAAASVDPHSPWGMADGWRPGHSGKRVVRLKVRDQDFELNCYGHDGDYRIIQGDVESDVRSAELRDGFIQWTQAGLKQRMGVVAFGDRMQLIEAGGRLELTRISPLFTASESGQGGDRLLAPMPGQIVSIETATGDSVEERQTVIIMEAMKMELSLPAPQAGTVAEIRCEAGQFVEADSVLLVLETQQ